jgi:hypothetical protein
VGGDDGKCLPPSACPARPALVCMPPVGSLRIGQVHPGDWTAMRSRGAKALAGEGDYVLENELIRVVIDSPDHPQGLAPSGGTILDMAPLGLASGDQLNGIVQSTGLLPRDVAHYRTATILDQSPDSVSVILRGTLDGNSRVQVVTRYELRPCESGVRVRTDLYNGSNEVNTYYLGDGYFWGDRGLMPFVPLAGQGFMHPDLDLLKLSAAWRQWPFMAARAQTVPLVGYAVVPCNQGRDEGFQDPTLSTAGLALAPTLPQDALVYERYIAVAGGAGLAPVVGEALRARADFKKEPAPVTVTGRVVANGAPFDGRDGRAASLLFYEPAPGGDPDAPSLRTPWSEAVPGKDGRFQVVLPPGRAFRAQPHAFGRPAGTPVAFSTGAPTMDIGDVAVERPARLLVVVEDEAKVPVPYADLVLVPAEPPAPGTAPSMYGLFGGCTPMLGPPHGASPACNRALVVDGKVELLAPPGHYFAYATRGPFATLGREEITVGPGEERALTLTSRKLPLLPPGTLNGDFHVHHAASFDSSLPAADRVISFLASGVDVLAATDHDVVTTYGEVLDNLQARNQLVVMPGVEMTPNVLWFKKKGDDVPKTVGHFNFWPVRYDAVLPRNGAPWDELMEPGAMMDAIEPIWANPAAGVRQMNHPWTKSKLGRDQGFLRMLKYDPRTPVQPGRSFAADVLLRSPAGGRRNIDFDTQEVITGAPRKDWVRYRTLWFSFLSQGILRAGVANSDTHTFAIEQAGYPRNLILGHHAVATFDPVAFNADVRAGRIVGTNGPVLDARLDSGAAPSLTPVPATRDQMLTVDVGAAPWIPVAELRFVVNGKVAKVVPVPLMDTVDFAGMDRHFQVKVSLGELLAGVTKDAWLVVEAGLPLPLAADLDNDGLPDTTDNNGDGVIDDRDIPADADDEDLRFRDPVRPPPGDPRFHLDAIAPGTWTYAFTNPFLLNLDGGEWVAPGL